MKIYRIQEQSDVFVDAFAADENQQLLFLSAYGRDTSVQQFMARIHQTGSQGGIEKVSLWLDGTASTAGVVCAALVGDARRLQKATGRMPKCNLLGNMVHIWIFDPKLLQVDHANRVAWCFHSQSGSTLTANEQSAALWAMVKELSPVPLLDDWADAVLSHLRAPQHGGTGGIKQPAQVGPIWLRRLEITEHFPRWVSEGVASGLLSVPPGPEREYGVDRRFELAMQA